MFPQNLTRLQSLKALQPRMFLRHLEILETLETMRQRELPAAILRLLLRKLLLPRKMQPMQNLRNPRRQRYRMREFL